MNKKKYAFTYWHSSPSNGFSHHEITVFERRGWHDALIIGSELFHFSAQCDDDRGHTVTQAYGAKVSIDLSSADAAAATKLVAKLAPHVGWNRVVPSMVKFLRSINAERYVLCDVGNSRKEFIPRKHARHAKAYWQARLAGLKVA